MSTARSTQEYQEKLREVCRMVDEILADLTDDDIARIQAALEQRPHLGVQAGTERVSASVSHREDASQ